MFNFLKKRKKDDNFEDTNDTETAACEECGVEHYKEDLDEDGYCESCVDFLSEAGWDAVDPDHNFDSYNDWDENGH